MTTSSISQYLVAEPDDPLNDAGGQSQAPLQNYLRERLLELRTRNYSNTGIADAKAIEKLTSEFEILVFGPARVGKSTLIRELSGDEEIRTSTGLNSCTQKTTAYTDQFGVRWWDTRGIEQWTEEEARSFLKEKFFDRHILPRGAIFCRTVGALANTPVLQMIFNQLKEHGITLFYVITRWPFLPRREQISIVDEAIELLGGIAQGIYPANPKRLNPSASQVEVVAPSSGFSLCGASRNRRAAATTAPTNAAPPDRPAYRALECEPDTSYIIPVNSCVDELGDYSSSSATNYPVMNMMLLRQLIILKTCRGADREQKLIDLYKNQMSLFVNMGYHALEVLDDLGYSAASFGLNKKEEEVYRALKQGGKNQHMATPTVKAVVDKVTSTISAPMVIGAIAGPVAKAIIKR